jgi:multidrug resistance efflux pump
MSEFHPNRVRPPRPRFTLRRALAFWPALVWLGVLAMAYWAYNKGVKFTRMNGLVDPITEAVAADEDSRISKILVRTGTKVKRNDKIVELDTGILDAQISKLEAAIRADLEDRLLSHELDLARLKAERRELTRDQAADAGELGAVQAHLEGLQAAIKARPAMEGPLAEAVGDASRDAARLKATEEIYPTQLKEVGVDIKRLEDEVAKIRSVMEDPDKLESMASANGDLSDLIELRVLKDRSTLRSGHDGTVDRVERDEGEFILKGDTILRIVADPEVIRVLLPNDQLGHVKVGDTVWASSIVDRYNYFETTIINMSPRVTNAPNTTSPLPNQILHGQEIIVKYPPKSGFVPGQPVIIHIEEPGTIPLVTRVFGGRGRAEQ